jgi:hypothetical protein
VFEKDDTFAQNFRYMRYLILAGKAILWTIIVFIMLLIIPYLFAPVYNFPEASVFQGDKLYNPYQGLNKNNWKKGNFQVQSRIWGGITNGSKNTNEMIDSTFRFLDYDVIGTSDYMQINPYKNEKSTYIPIYEHGWSIFKTHQVVLGAKKVNWLDYFYLQSPSHKQHIINKLKGQSDLLILAHPCLRDGYKTSDFKKLNGYDAIEILNFYCESVYHWDTALSTGHYVTAIGNDDVHDITNPDEVGQYFTYINTNSLGGDSVIKAIKDNKTYAVQVFRWPGDSWELRKEKHDKLAKLQSADLFGDTLIVKVNQKAKSIKFIGQNGKLKKEVQDTAEAFYVIKETDTYIRTEVEFPSRDKFYLNPVVRYQDNWPQEIIMPTINYWKTWIYRILAIGVYSFIAYLLFLWIRKSRKKA